MLDAALTATANPNRPPASTTSEVNLSVWLQPPEESLVKTYAEPEFVPLSSSWDAPTTTLLSSTATEKPNQSSAAPSRAFNLACRIHISEESLMKT